MQTIARTLTTLIAMAVVPVSLAQSAPPRPHIANVQCQNDATLINGGGNAGEIYYLQACNDLSNPIDWKIVGTNAADLQGQWQFTDCAASNSPARFYRAFWKLPPNYNTTPLFSMGMVARGNISFSSSVLLDSFDSANPSYSTGGHYDPAKAQDNCLVGTVTNGPSAISASGGGRIKGTLHTGLNGKVNLSGGSSVGAAAWVDGGNAGIQSGHWLEDMSVTFADVVAPQGAGLTPVAGSYGGTNYNYVLSGDHGFYKVSTLNLSGSQKMIVTGKNVSLYVTGNVTLSGKAAVYFAPGASLAMYVGGANCTFSGGGIVNAGNALQFQYYGLPGNTALVNSSGAPFVGIIYAPEADYTMNGTSYTGASVTKTVTMQGGGSFHFDENVKNAGPLSGFLSGNSSNIARP